MTETTIEAKEEFGAVADAPWAAAARGEVYFVSDGEHIKIGYSAAPKVRMEVLQGGTGRALVLLGTVPGSMSTERSFHAQFDYCRVRGEWFRPSADLVACIRDACGDHEELTRLDPVPAWYRLVRPEAQALKAWALHQPDDVRYCAQTLAQQMVIGAKHPDSRVAKAVVEMSVQHLAALRVGALAAPPEISTARDTSTRRMAADRGGERSDV